jgi:hypothetical protein
MPRKPSKNPRREKKPPVYLLLHRHQYGTTAALFTTDDWDPHKIIDEDKIIALAHCCGLDYEPHKNESVEILDYDNKTVTHVSEEDLN